MLSSVFQSLCAGCGGVCGFKDILCEKCVKAIKRIEHACGHCGRPLNVQTSYCGFCADKDRGKGIDYYYADYLFEGAARKMILDVKYNWRIRGAAQIGRLCECSGVDFAAYDAACVIPCHFLRNFMRYFQPVNIIKNALSEKIKFEKLLARTRYTVYQSRLSKKERVKNIKGVFETRTPVNGKKIIIIDDVMTTGSTLKEAAVTLKKAGAAVVDVYALFARRPA
jgi:ComF family protein